MDANRRQLTRTLKEAGLSAQVIEAAWPTWWSDSANASPAAKAELRFSLARRLGLSPKALIGDRVEFVWRDHVRFKNLTVTDENHRAALNSFGLSVARMLFQATPPSRSLSGIAVETLRSAILNSQTFVDLAGLLATCWGLGAPVIHLRVFPLPAKSMHAMVVQDAGRIAVLLLRDTHYPAPATFWIAHELGHACLGHLRDGEVIADVFEPDEPQGTDEEEVEADRFALALLTGESEPKINTNIEEYGARQLAEAVLTVAPQHRIEPGTLALCLAYQTSRWATATASLRYIYRERKPVWREINGVARRQLDWGTLSDDSSQYLKSLMALGNA